MLRVLFLCTGNACRSQMAEGFARHLVADRIDAASAGVEKHSVDRRAVAMMAEAGVDIAGQKSKLVSELPDADFDFVITLCDDAAARCPAFPGTAKVIRRPFDDPPRLAADAPDEETALNHYRRVRDEIRAFVERLPAFLAADRDPDMLAPPHLAP